MLRDFLPDAAPTTPDDVRLLLLPRTASSYVYPRYYRDWMETQTRNRLRAQRQRRWQAPCWWG